jgi:P4 family phage/plasmid primase-like protien
MMFADTTPEQYGKLSEERHISVDTLRRYGLAWYPLRDCWLIPAYNHKGKIANCHCFFPKNKGRCWFPEFHLHLFGLQFLTSHEQRQGKKVATFEGIWDLLAFYDELVEQDKTEQYDLLALPGASNYRYVWENWHDYAEALICLDNDATGKRHQAKIIELAFANGVETPKRGIMWPLGLWKKVKDIRDYRTQDTKLKGLNLLEYVESQCKLAEQAVAVAPERERGAAHANAEVKAKGYHSLLISEGWTDANNAARLRCKFGDEIRWVGLWDKWLTWDGSCWRIDYERTIDRYAKEIAADMFAEITLLAKKGKLSEDKLRAATIRFASYANSKRGIDAMVGLARSEPGMPLSQDRLDQEPWLFNVLNGTIDLRTGEMREHCRDDFITKISAVVFDPAAQCPLWEAFLEKIFEGNQELISYLQRLVGYCLTGVSEEHILPFLYGVGANGKSTFCETILRLLGTDYAMKAAPDLLLAKRGESHPTDRADLFGRRFVACIETEEGRRLAEALVKEMTGGDRMRVRRMREDFWEFVPTHHIWLASNHKPVIRGTDHGVWRRIKLIPFDVVIPDKRQDKKLHAKLAKELPGILNWAIAGCLDWQKHGMREPKIVQAATREYSSEMDDVGRFIDDCCEQGEFIGDAKELHTAFQSAMECTITPHSFTSRLREKGFQNRDPATGKEYRTTKGRRGWKGLRLRTDAREYLYK